MQSDVPVLVGILEWVSILTRPEGRMQFKGPQGSRYTYRFNPHPARRPDAIRSYQDRYMGHTSFNPHPARRPDAISSLELPSDAF